MSIQNILKNAVSLHHVMSASELGKDAHKEWVNLVDACAEPAYALFSVTHDNAGRPVAIVNEEAAREARHALSSVLRPIVKLVGNVSFANNEGEALLEVNADFVTLFSNIGWEMGWVYSDEVIAIRESIKAQKNALSVAKAWLEYYELGDNEQEKSARRAAVAAIENTIAALDAERKAAESKVNGKVWGIVPRDMENKESAFRKDFESLLCSVIDSRNKASWTDYQNKKKAEKAAKNARQAEKRAVKKDIANRMTATSAK